VKAVHCTGTLLAVSLLTFLPGAQNARAGMVILTGQDSDFTASFAPCSLCYNPAGAQSFLSTAIQDVRAGSSKPFLFVESSITPPAAVMNPDGTINGAYAFQTDGIQGIENSGYIDGVDFVKADASTLEQQLTQYLASYSAIVVASDFGGILTGAELQILNDNAGAIDNFLLSGGGLLALGESNDGIGPNATYSQPGNILNPNEGLLGSVTPYGFLPFAVQSANSYGVFESTSDMTSFGATEGFAANDFSGNFFFNTLKPETGFNILDTDPQGDIVAVEVAVILPEPATMGLAGIGLAIIVCGCFRRRPIARHP
jgi:hypothetical protein